MKHFFLVIGLTLFFSPALLADPIVIPGVKVSVSDKSAAAARERAIAQGHRIAFHKALRQLGLDGDSVGGTPTDNEIMAMAKSFSPDIEKQTATSYAASFTFQFDDQTLMAWANGMQDQMAESSFGDARSPLSSPTDPMINTINMPEKMITVTVPLNGLGDMVAVERTFEKLPNIRGNRLKTFSKQAAEYELRIIGDPRDINIGLAEHGWKFEQRGTQYLLVPQYRSVS